MNAAIPLHRRISFKLARLALGVAMAVGLLVSAVQVSLDFANQRQENAEIVTRILNAADPTAQRAILTLDPFLAQEVVNGLISYEFIIAATIDDELGTTLAQADRRQRMNSPTRWLTPLLADEFERFDVQLSVPKKPPDQSGRLSVVIDTDRALLPFYMRASVTLLSVLLLIVFVVLLFLAIFYILITKPLLRVIGDLTDVDPDDPERPMTPISPLSPSHRHDELGMLRDTGNRFIAAISARMHELRESNAALAFNEQRFKDYTAAASDWFWEQDANLRFIALPDNPANPAFTDNYVWTGKRLWEVDGADVSEPKWAALMADLDARREFRKFRTEHELPDGRIRKLEISGMPYFDPSGAFCGYRGVATDVTETARVEEQLAHTANLESLGRLTGGIAHDFNNLLAIIQGNLELLGEELEEQELPSDRVATSIQATLRGSELTQQLLAIARRQHLVTKPVNINQIIAGTQKMLLRVLESTVHIKTYLAEDLWIADIDVSRMENVLINLALNARDAMPEGGLLMIETGNITIAADSAAHFGSDVIPGDYVRLTLSDTGVGMPPDVQKRIFEPFYTTKPLGSGTGLGLSQIHGFIKQSGGYISVYSEPDNGTTFQLYLPRSLKSPHEFDSRETAPADTSKLPDAQVLIVEDNPDLRQLARTIVEGLGLRVLESGSGEEAVTIAKAAGGIDLLLSDIVLTGQMTGRDVGDTLQELYPDIAIIYMSGYAERALLHRGQSDPGATLLQKPFQRKELINAIANLLSPAPVL
ncbi:ATP-binding protein [Breoghania sp. L-A4]|uniref:ATP-binding protein n=1 Tax=Breoghania sp. L-A4 TaxID=2304600 RepID=UPI000E35EC81|nr:ATP-binding protein [Breoghania sp. L-A4]AXS40946.1 response regulator [Breoghania sp. L-A4]